MLSGSIEKEARDGSVLDLCTLMDPRALQFTLLYSSVPQRTPVSSVLQVTQVYFGVLQCTLVCSSVLQCIPAYSSVLLCIPAYPSVLQCTLSHGDPFIMSGRAYITPGIRASPSRVGCQKCSDGTNLFPRAILLLA